jgi:hypothetical protein
MKKIIMVVAAATLVMVSCQDASNVTATSNVDSTQVMKSDSTLKVDSCAQVINAKDSSKTQK